MTDRYAPNMSMDDTRWRYLLDYPARVFGADPSLEGLMERAKAADLPPIAISAGAGQLLRILTAMTNGQLAVEVGTLGGYSGINIINGLHPDGRLITIEYDDNHADFAQSEFDKAGLTERVTIVRGAALDVLPGLVASLDRTIDLVFLDAEKHEYIDYFEEIRNSMTTGGLVVADNVYGVGIGWLDEGYGTDDFNRHVAAGDDFDATTIHVGGGLLIARRL